jgi:hypothetical protein
MGAESMAHMSPPSILHNMQYYKPLTAVAILRRLRSGKSLSPSQCKMVEAWSHVYRYCVGLFDNDKLRSLLSPHLTVPRMSGLQKSSPSSPATEDKNRKAEADLKGARRALSHYRTAGDSFYELRAGRVKASKLQ